MAARKALVVGGGGALGRAVVRAYSRRGWQATSLDFAPNDEAERSVLMANEYGRPWSTQLDIVGEVLGEEEYDAVVSVAGGFAGGGLSDGTEPLEQMWDMNVKSAFGAAVLAYRFLRSDGTLVLTGAQAAQEGGAGFALGYSMTKAATYNLALTLGSELGSPGASLPEKSKVLCFFPATIDTPANREAMPDADFAAWQTPEAIADFLVVTSERGELDPASEAAAGLEPSGFWSR